MKCALGVFILLGNVTSSCHVRQSVTCFTVLIHNKGMMIEGRYSRCPSLADVNW